MLCRLGTLVGIHGRILTLPSCILAPASEYRAGGWTGARAINIAAGSTEDAQVAMANGEDAVVVWTQGQGAIDLRTYAAD